MRKNLSTCVMLQSCFFFAHVDLSAPLIARKFSHKNKRRRGLILSSERLASRNEICLDAWHYQSGAPYFAVSNLIETRREPWRYRADNPKILIDSNPFLREGPAQADKKKPRNNYYNVDIIAMSIDNRLLESFLRDIYSRYFLRDISLNLIDVK